ncbi:MAG: hypothetical protein JW893_02025 [Candidatus Omnitrophica bacterium]|nr:hypothetical protein [Candidatus Omnitrophota bacterium]
MTEANHFFRVWKWTVVGAVCWWALGLNLFIFHAVTLYLFIRLIFVSNTEDQGVVLMPSFFLLLGLFLIYAFSILIHAPTAEGKRVVASLYNLSFWGVGLMLVVVLTNAFELKDIRSLLSVFYRFAWLMSFLVLATAFAAFFVHQEIAIKTPLYGLTDYLGKETLVLNSLVMKPLHWDWFAEGLRPRFMALTPYSTATGGVMVIILLSLMTWAAVERKLGHPVFLFLFIVNFAGLVMCLSRTCLVAFMASVIMMLFLQRRYFILWMLLFLGLLFLAMPWIEGALAWLLSAREGSTTNRLALYEYSLEQFEGVDWIFGFGLKERDASAFSIPIGSHSTYLSLLYKTGLAGFILFLILQAVLMVRWYGLKNYVVTQRNLFLFWRGLGAILFAMTIWMATDDLDAPQLLAFLYFSWVGLFEAFHLNVMRRWVSWQQERKRDDTSFVGGLSQS